MLPPIARRDHGAWAPLSFAQQRLWLLDQMVPDNPAYNIAVVVRLDGRLEVAALAAALSGVVARHEALRTVFTSHRGEPRQVVTPALPVPLPVVDLRALAAGPRRAAAAEELLAEGGLHRFDLAKGPLLRVLLLRLGNAEHVFLAVAHHIVADGWSMGILTEELAILYGAHLDGRPAPLAPLPIQYSDFAAWQREWMAGEALAGELAYWRERLAGELPLANLPARQPRPLVQTFAGAGRRVAVAPELVRRIRALAREGGTTLFVALLASFAVLLGRYGGQTDVVVGTPVAGRSREETERLIGFFVNTLVLRQDLAGDPSFRQLLRRLGPATVEALAHQDLPFDKLVEALAPARQGSHSPFFRVLLVLENAPVELPVLPGLRLERLPLASRTAKFDLTLKLEEEGEALTGVLEYNTGLFAAATADHLAGHWTNLLAGLAAEPDRRISRLALLGCEELRERAAQWHAQARTEGEAMAVELLPVHILIARQAMLRPAAPALVGEERCLSYGELEAEANRLANHLQSLGVSTDSRVALLLDRSAAMVVSLVAVLKAGGAYVPLDPEQPAERLAAMLSDAEPTALITAGRWLEKLPPVLACQLVLLDADAAEIASSSSAAPPALAQCESLAYVIYTSGSTGAPKGVAVAHRTLAGYVAGAAERLGLAACSSFALVSTPAADLGHTVLFPSLTTGGCLLVVGREPAVDAEMLAVRFDAVAVDCLKIVPSHLQALLLGRRPEAVLPRRCLVLGGEPPSADLVRQVRALAPGLMVFNHYGPTETTVGVITHEVRREPVPGEAVPLSSPLPGVSIHLLDAAGEPVPAEVVGEVYVGGSSLARGYLAQPDRTAEVFLPDPFSALPGARLYRTGDRARLRPDGALEIVGRSDGQVKVRGFRVELGEIEAALGDHPGVARAIVTLHQDPGGGRRLVAYVAGADGMTPPAEELRRHLAGRLPDYMVPGQYVSVAAFPLSANGKLDRAALPAPDAGVDATEEVAGGGAPSPIEEVVCSIWSKVLGVGEVSVRDNFFDLGGHSVLATQVMARIQEAFKMELPVLSLFELPTVAGLARRIELGMKEASALQMSVPGPVPRQAEMPLSFAQQRLWFLHQLEPESAAYNMAGAMRASGRLDIAALRRSLAEIVGRHEVLRTTFHRVAGRPALRIHPRMPLAVPLVDLGAPGLAARGSEAGRLAVAEARRAFDLSAGPLLRATLLRLAAEEYLLLLGMHHIVSDGWSVGIILSELATLYEAFSAGRPSPLPELPLQYADFAVWQRQWMAAEVLATQLEYWRRQLSGMAPVLALSTDRPHPPSQTFRGARLAFTVDLPLVAGLKKVSRERDATLFMTLLAVFGTLLYHYSGQDDFAVGSPIAGRSHRELEGLVGFFVNTLAMRARPAPDLPFTELLERTRATALGAYTHQDLPFEHLVEVLEIERDLARPPIFQTMFVWQNIPTPLARLSGLTLVPLEGDTQSAKLELTLSLQEMQESMLGSLEYNSDLFDAATAERMAGHLRNLMAAVAARPTDRLADLPWLSAAELDQIAGLWEGSATLPAAATGADVCTLFAAQVARAPGATAARDAGGALTYEELDRRSDRLMHRLRSLGTPPETVVALALPRGLALLVAVLGVLKSGAAYLPLDPQQPAARQLEILARSGAALLVAGGSAATELAASFTGGSAGSAAQPAIVLIEEGGVVEGGAGTPGGSAAAESPAAPESLAYVIYTSGSTGRPKGVMIERRGMLNHLLAKVGDLALGSTDAVAQTASQCFDISIWQLLAALLVGGRVEILGDEITHDPARLLEALEGQGVTVFETVPSLLQVLLATHERQGAAGPRLVALRWLIPTGEALSAALCRQWHARFPGVPLLNAYGPTECSDDVSHHRIDAPPEAYERVPLGRAIANLRLYVLDPDLRPLPLGVVGELCVGGVGVGRGYLGDPAQTAGTFAPDPWSAPGARLYRTGDRARLRPDGAVEFLGRRDDQVKVRGFRVEPGEIEAALLRHPAVREVVVLARDEAPHGRRLVAYLVPDGAAAPTPAALRAFLEESLPNYMVPAAFVVLGRLPLGPGGKVDRRALPAPPADRFAAAGMDGAVAPRTRIEQQLLEIWQEALGVARLGITDDFFSLGGHSLLAVRLIVMIEDRLGVSLPLASLFRGATVEHLAHLIATRAGAASLWLPLVAIQPAGSRPPLFVVHPTGGDVLCYHPLARLLGEDQPLYGLQARGLEAGSSPLTSIPEMAACYLAALRAAQAQGPYRLAGWSFGGVVAYEMARQLVSGGEEVALLAILDSLAPVAGEGVSATPLSRAQWASWFELIAREFAGVFHQDLGLTVEDLAPLAPAVQLQTFVERLERIEFLPPGAGLSIAESFRSIHEANTLALWSYAATAEPYAGPAMLFRSAEALLLGDSWSRASHEGGDLGWSQLVRGRLAVYEVPGNHNTLLSSPNVEVLVERLATCLETVAAGDSSPAPVAATLTGARR